MSQDAGARQLRATLEEFSSALQAFNDPTVDEVAGLRLMRAVLGEREQHLREQIVASETASLELTVEHGQDATSTLDLPLVIGLLDAVQETVTACGLGLAADAGQVEQAEAAAALVLHLAACDGASLRLQRAPGTLDTQLSEPDSRRPLVDRALDAVVGVLAVADDAQRLAERTADLPPAATAALGRLGRLLAGRPVRLRLALRPGALRPRDALVTRTGAQALAVALAEDD